MIVVKQGDLFQSGAEALINPVNCHGSMGAGIAKEFKRRYPNNFLRYQRECGMGQVVIGRIFVSQEMGVHIVNFPTKQHWRSASKYSWIAEGLSDLKSWLISNKIESVAIPALGCGLGELDWKIVRPMIEDSLWDIPNIEITVFEPRT